MVAPTKQKRGSKRPRKGETMSAAGGGVIEVLNILPSRIRFSEGGEKALLGAA
jgi:hypothetical protein